MDVSAALVIVRALNFTFAAGALGIPAVLAAALLPAMMRAQRTDGERPAALLRRLLGICGAAVAGGLISGALWLVLTAGAMSGSDGLAAAPDSLGAVLLRTHFGTVAMVRAALAIIEGVCLALVLPARTPDRRIVVLAAAALAGAAGVAAIAWAGHAVATPERLHLVGDAAHLVAAGIWIGGLVVLVAALGTIPRETDIAWVGIVGGTTRRFSELGLWSVAVLLATGMINGWFLVGTLPALVGTDYGHLLLIKVALFAAMVGVAAVNRFRLTPRIVAAVRRKRPADAISEIRSLRRNTLVVLAMGVLVLGVVGALGTLPPGLHDRPWWPFGWRLSLGAMALPALREEVRFAAAMMIVGLALCLFAMARRRYRLIGIPVGLALVVSCLPVLRPLVVPAFPTTFIASPVAYSTQSIMRGEAIFADQCTPCHGLHGTGDGPHARELKVPPADLTAAHIYDHPEGDIFWWVSAGIPESGMPGYGSALGEDERWDLVNFVRAVPAGGLGEGLADEVGQGPSPRAPDFSFTAADGGESSLQALLQNGPVLLVLFTPAEGLARLQFLAAARRRLSEAGLQILAVPLDDRSEAGPSALPGFVAGTDASVPAAYRLIASSPRYRLPTTARHLEFMIDRAGYARALWLPQETVAWGTLESLIARTRELARWPLARAPSSAHVH